LCSPRTLNELALAETWTTTMPDASPFAMRPAVLNDLDALAAIDARCFPSGIVYPIEEIASLLRATTVLTLVVERSDQIVGFASLRLLPRSRFRDQSPRGELITIDVLPEFRRERVGWQLHRELEDWLRAGGGTSIELHVAVSNAAAISFYQRLGYSVIARVPNYYLKTLDALRMEKVLT
jgi:ribosomal-protein-alanine N-acetyltransferase